VVRGAHQFLSLLAELTVIKRLFTAWGEGKDNDRSFSKADGQFGVVMRLRRSPSIVSDSRPNILIPQRRILPNKLCHQRDASRFLRYFDYDAPAPKQLFLSHERLVLADNDTWNPIKQDCAGAHRAGGKRRVQHALGVNRRGQSAGVFQGVHFSVQDRTAALHAAIVATADDLAAMDDDGTNGNAPLGEARFGFGNGRGHEWIHGLDSD
jgi:hypothetical protein